MLKTQHSIKSPESWGLFILVFFHAIAAYFSFGFHHPDEHFQILEFANYWAGIAHDPAGLPWEFTKQIRPWFQPMLHGVVMKTALAMNLYNPFTLAFLFRLFYAGLNITGIWLLWGEFKKRYSLNPLWFLWLSMIWFFPYIHVRTSSENLAGILVTFAFLLFMRNKSQFWIGLLFGFAFLARYQTALGIAGFGVFLLVRDKKVTKAPVHLTLGFCIPVILGVILDRIGYGDWVFTPYRYFKVNLVDGVAATYNPYPWYQYFIWIAQLNPLVSLPLCMGVIFYIKRVRFDAFAAFVTFFFILHLFITNKEYRFLFPILNLVPFMVAVGYQDLTKLLMSGRSLSAYAFINVIGFSVSSLHGAAVETLWSMNAVNHYSAPGELWISNREYPDQFAHGYYQIKDTQLLLIHNGEELDAQLKAHPNVKVLIDGHLEDEATVSMLAVVEKHHCELLSSARPHFLYGMQDRFPGIKRWTYKAAYQCEP